MRTAIAVVLCSLTIGSLSRADADPADYVAPKNKALLVVARDEKSFARAVTYRVTDERGRCLAVLESGWQSAIPLHDGKQILLLIVGNAPPQVELLRVDLDVGRTYVVRLNAKFRAKHPVEIEPLRRSEARAQMFPLPIRETRPRRGDLEACTAWVKKRKDKITPRVAAAEKTWSEGGKPHQNARTVREEDGWTAEEVQRP